MSESHCKGGVIAKMSPSLTRLGALWSILRTLACDDAYERYLAHHTAMHAGAPVLSRREFYLNEQHRKWSGISRCC